MTSNPRRSLQLIAFGAIGAALTLIASEATSSSTIFAFIVSGLLVGCLIAGFITGVIQSWIRETLGSRDGFPWHWFKFNARLALVFTTIVALYFGATVTWGRVLGLSHNQIFSYGFDSILWGCSQMIVFAVAALAFINRWSVHPRVSRLALLSLAITVGVVFCDTLYGLAYYSTNWDEYSTVDLISAWLWWLTTVSFRIISLGLLVAAVLVDRERPPQPVDERDETARASSADESSVDSRGQNDQQS